MVYGLNSWDWNVYSDGLYAYAFPTFSTAYGGIGVLEVLCISWGWNYDPYYYSGWYGPGWSVHHHWGNPYWVVIIIVLTIGIVLIIGYSRPYYNRTYTNRRSYGTYGDNYGYTSRRTTAQTAEHPMELALVG